MISPIAPSALERWYSRYGFTVRYNLSGSAAPSLPTAALLAYAGSAAADAYLALDLNYGPAAGSSALRQAIAAHYTTIAAADIQVTTGAAEALLLLFSALVTPGATVIVEAPIYPSIGALIEACGAVVQPWPLQPDGTLCRGYLEQLLADPTVCAVVLNHPHGPTGALLHAAELRAIAATCEARGVRLVVDEVYRGIQFTEPVAPAAADLGSHVVSVGDVSKAYGLGGLRVGWIATRDDALVRRCSELRDYTSLCNSAPAEFLAVIALNHSAAIIAGHLALARYNRTAFAAALAGAPWLDWQLSHGGFTIFPRLRDGRCAATFSRELRAEYDVLVLPGDVFNMPGHLRIGFGVAADDFATGLERLVAFGARAAERTR